MPTDNARAARLDALFGTPAFAVAFAVLCNCFWGSAFPFIKLGYRLFAIDAADTASILCFAGVRFMLGSVLVLLASFALEGRRPALPRGRVLAECCALGLWQTTAQYAFYYAAVALLTGAFGGILNSTQSFLGVILAHFLYRSDRMTPAKAAGCVIGFAGVLVATIGNHGGGSGWGIFCMMAATVIFTAGAGRLPRPPGPAGRPGPALPGLCVGGRLRFVGPADEKQPCQPDQRVRPGQPGGQRPAVRPAQRRTPVRVAVSGGPGPGLRRHLAGQPPRKGGAPGMSIYPSAGPIFDTHAHYSSGAFNADRYAVLDGLPAQGVVGVCEQATHSGDAPRCLELAHRYPWVWAAIGIHPESLLPADKCGSAPPAPTVSV